MTVATAFLLDGLEWDARRLLGGLGFTVSPGWTLYHLEPALVVPGNDAVGVAVTDDGRLFLLSSDEGMQAFLLAAGTLLSWTEVASVLAFYRSVAPGRESLVTNRSELERRLGNRAGELPDDVDLVAADGPDGSWRMWFCTLYLTHDDRGPLANVNQWYAGRTGKGEIWWRSEPVLERAPAHY